MLDDADEPVRNRTNRAGSSGPKWAVGVQAGPRSVDPVRTTARSLGRPSWHPPPPNAASPEAPTTSPPSEGSVSSPCSAVGAPPCAPGRPATPAADPAPTSGPTPPMPSSALPAPSCGSPGSGDSLAAGLGVDDVADTPAHVVARMLERPVEVRMLAHPGARTDHVLADQLPRLGADTDLVVISVGANDVAARGSRADYAARIDAILRATAPIPTIVLSLPGHGDGGPHGRAAAVASPGPGAAGSTPPAPGWPPATTTSARSTSASPPTGLTRRTARAHLCADRFHPGPQGYRVWAERIATVAHAMLPPLGAPSRRRRRPRPRPPRRPPAGVVGLGRRRARSSSGSRRRGRRAPAARSSGPRCASW